MKKSPDTIPAAVRYFDDLPDGAFTSISVIAMVYDRSRASQYRDNKAGRIKFAKNGNSTRVNVGDARRVYGGV